MGVLFERDGFDIFLIGCSNVSVFSCTFRGIIKVEIIMVLRKTCTEIRT